jgi:hypothetical protein
VVMFHAAGLRNEEGISPELASAATASGRISISQFVTGLSEPPFTLIRALLTDAVVRYRPPARFFASGAAAAAAAASAAEDPKAVTFMAWAFGVARFCLMVRCSLSRIAVLC